jgi:hypothetical protein
LRKASEENEIPTYAGLLDQLPPLPDQIPQCEGENKHALLFSTRRPKQFFNADTTNDGMVRVYAGYSQGVVSGTEFQLYLNTSSSSSLGVFCAISVTSTSSILRSVGQASISDVSRRRLYARVTKWNNHGAQLKVFIKDPNLLATLSDKISQTPVDDQAAQAGIMFAPTHCSADIVLHNNEGAIDIERTDDIIGHHTSRNLSMKIDDDVSCRLARTLRSAAHFKFHFARARKSNPPEDGVTMELYRLKQSPFLGYYKPTGPNLLQNGDARIVHNSEPYGITLRNGSANDYFPSLFYFDPSDYSIHQWYLPPSPTMSAPLHRESKLTVGHGNYDAPPARFNQAPDEDYTTGFLVLYLSSQYADMTHIANHGTRGIEFIPVTRDYGDAVYAIVTVERGVDEPIASDTPLAAGDIQQTDTSVSTLCVPSI